MVKILNQQNLPNLPWEERPAGYTRPVWRYSQNPVIRRDLLPTSNSIFNSAVVPYDGVFAGVFRCDLCYWGKHRHVMSPVDNSWMYTKVGAGPVPIETSEGWLLIYHGVLTSCNGFVYSAGTALLDLDHPWKVIARSRHYILSPQTLYECVGDVPNVVFPCVVV